MKYKNLILKSIILLIIPLMGFKKDKCNSDPLYDQALLKLKKFSVLKDYRIYMKKNKNLTPADYQYVTLMLTRGVVYKFQTLSSNEFEGKLIMTLYANTKKEFLIATNLSQGSKTIYESIDFECFKTGEYCLGFYFADGLEGCGVAVSSFKQ